MADQTPDPIDGRQRVNWLRVEEVRSLDHWCRNLRRMFPTAHGVYLVGSTLTRADYRDVDIRIVFPDGKAPKRIDLKDLHMLLSQWGERQTGLPIDCQTQTMSESSEFDGPIRARGLL